MVALEARRCRVARARGEYEALQRKHRSESGDDHATREAAGSVAMLRVSRITVKIDFSPFAPRMLPFGLEQSCPGLVESGTVLKVKGRGPFTPTEALFTAFLPGITKTL